MIASVFTNKILKPKEKVDLLSQQLLSSQLDIVQLVNYALTAKDSEKASCIEAIEFASRQTPHLVDKFTFEFLVEALNEKAPRIKWESAKIIGHTAHLFPSQLDLAITNLLVNTEHAGTVVRWSAAYALGEILKQKTVFNVSLIPTITAICKREEKNSIRKIYLTALQKVTGNPSSKR